MVIRLTRDRRRPIHCQKWRWSGVRTKTSAAKDAQRVSFLVRASRFSERSNFRYEGNGSEIKSPSHAPVQSSDFAGVRAAGVEQGFRSLRRQGHNLRLD